MKNPIRAFIEESGISTNELARKTGMTQPTVYRHAFYDQLLGFVSMEAYASVGISWEDLRGWNNYLLSQKKEDQQGGSHAPGSNDDGTPSGSEDP